MGSIASRVSRLAKGLARRHGREESACPQRPSPRCSICASEGPGEGLDVLLAGLVVEVLDAPFCATESRVSERFGNETACSVSARRLWEDQRKACFGLGWVLFLTRHGFPLELLCELHDSRRVSMSCNDRADDGDGRARHLEEDGIVVCSSNTSLLWPVKIMVASTCPSLGVNISPTTGSQQLKRRLDG
jgi:hypothetical protein